MGPNREDVGTSTVYRPAEALRHRARDPSKAHQMCEIPALQLQAGSGWMTTIVQQDRKMQSLEGEPSRLTSVLWQTALQQQS